MSRLTKEKLKNLAKFIFALFFFIFILLLNVLYWAAIVVGVKWIISFMIPNIGWKIPILVTFLFYVIKNISVRMLKRK